ncbi:MAG TPA: DUF4388 domain-containing protein [Anaeromyxobacteraceae bacterium]|nr:DUF4388 domain-containing protein [Anaeromyxobacteraceae bacterium]
MSFLEAPGDLSRTPLAAILIEIWNLRLSGSLTVEQGGGASRLFFREGVPAGAQVFVGFRPLGHFLLAKGLIDMEALERCLAEMARARRPQGEILVELGVIDRPTLDAALSEQQEGYISLIAGLQEGGYHFDAQVPVPPWTDPIRIRPLRAIVDALSTPQAGPLAAAALAQAGEAISLGAAYPDQAQAFGWTLAEEALVAGLPGSVEPLVSASGLAPERARAALAALLLLGLAEGSGGPRAASREEPVGVVDLADIALAPARPAAPAAPAAPSPPGKRSDPEEARARRQRLLSRAMQNMGLRPMPAPAPARPEAMKEAAGARPEQSQAERAMRRALEFVLPRIREKDFFARLGLPKTAGPEDVKGAYHQLVKQFHPDKYTLPGLADLQPALKDLLSALNEAYATLSDKARRQEYLSRAGAPSSKELAEAARMDFEKGEACHRTRDYARARQFFEAAINAHPLAEYRAALAATLLADPKGTDRGRVKELLAEATKDESCDRAFSLAGVLARQEGDKARAEKMFRAALKANPKNADALRELRLIEGVRRGAAEERAGSKK